MNTNDFYKELMSEYSFDYEKIRKAAMGKSVQAKKSRLKTVWLSVAGAAAAVAITFSSVALLNSGSPVVVSPTTSISAEDRFRMAMEGIQQGGREHRRCFPLRYLQKFSNARRNAEHFS